jgi:hypothetical protein
MSLVIALVIAAAAVIEVAGHFFNFNRNLVDGARTLFSHRRNLVRG